MDANRVLNILYTLTVHPVDNKHYGLLKHKSLFCSLIKTPKLLLFLLVSRPLGGRQIITIISGVKGVQIGAELHQVIAKLLEHYDLTEERGELHEKNFL